MTSRERPEVVTPRLRRRRDENASTGIRGIDGGLILIFSAGAAARVCVMRLDLKHCRGDVKESDCNIMNRKLNDNTGVNVIVGR